MPAESIKQHITLRRRCAVRFLQLIMTVVLRMWVHMKLPRLPNRALSMYEVAKRNYIKGLLHSDDTDYRDQLRMNRHCFSKLCQMLGEVGGLRSTRYVNVDEQVAMTLYILAHHKKNRVIKFDFGRSGSTVSRYFNKVILSILRCHGVLTKKPEPITPAGNDERWSCFENCLGAIDGVHIELRVPLIDRPRYRNRKGQVTTNVLAACSPDMQIIYVQPGWEGSAADSRVLRDALSRQSGLRVPRGCYYLVDAGYANAEGFLAPYRGVRYHLNEWRIGHQPTNAREYFNMKHARARNVIERCFGLLKMRWSILRSTSYYPMEVHNRIVHACCLLQNFIRREMDDPLEDDIPLDFESTEPDSGDFIGEVRASAERNTWRDQLAETMYNEWIGNGVNNHA